MSTVVCVLARPLIVAAVLDGDQTPGWVAAHRDRCLKCQATEARARSTGRSMRMLEAVGAGGSPPDLADSVVSALDRSDTDARPAPSVPWFAVVAGVAALIVMARRLRRG